MHPPAKKSRHKLKSLTSSLWKNIKIRAIAIFLALILTSGDLVGQCAADDLVMTCIPKLISGFNFLKSYKIDSSEKKDKVEHSYVFTKGTQYMIVLCTSGTHPSDVTINLLDSKRNKVASLNFLDQVGSIHYSCNTTGIFYIQYLFSTEAICGGSVLAFKR
jgi:hypothetical protein